MPCDRARRRRERYESLQITAWLQTGVVGDPSLPIDAVIYYAAHRASLAPRMASHAGAFTARETEDAVTLPLAIVNGASREWYYAASSAQWPTVVADGTDHWTCRFDGQLAHLLESPTGRLDTASGRYRGYHMPVYYRHALSVWWYVRGDRERLTDLLRGVSHLGKKTSQGWGAVRRWEVEICADDWSVTGPGGALMRPVPTTDPEAPLIGYRPPYWHPRRQAPCRVPLRG
jgi:hypothetical protein